MANTSLGTAKKAKNDEFYTRWEDIEREMNAYRNFDPDVFRGKVVLLPCDDPEWSNFAKYFALHFEDFGIKKLISTSFAPKSNFDGTYYEPTLFETEDPAYDAEKSMTRGRKFVLDSVDLNEDGRIDYDDLRWEYLEGDGDFRSEEITKLRDQVDIVVTNPPFSLFREFLAWLMEGDVAFSIIGPTNAITYKEVFPLIRDGEVWLGRGFSGGNAYFRVPEAARDDYAAGVFDEETSTVHFRNISWYTNLEHGQRHEPLELMTMEDNLRFSRRKVIRESGYPRYDNYDAIEVSYTEAIPSDYEGLMGVPISFLDRHNPEQFEVLGITKTWDDDAGLKQKIYPTQTQVSKKGSRSQVGKLNDGAAIEVSEPPESTYYEVDGKMFKQPYARILIRKKGS
ncbi:adenine-specific methyltransferase EcoRI family protein [Trueperella sp.]|uniref:adenine-specific methyltransferase EcoRI family protein n=1 Tax=Trueperella sp. TaxID=2699835 RepID=UPI0037351D7A